MNWNPAPETRPMLIKLGPSVGVRLDEAITLAHKIRRYGGIFVVLIHPNILGHKLEF